MNSLHRVTRDNNNNNNNNGAAEEEDRATAMERILEDEKKVTKVETRDPHVAKKRLMQDLKSLQKSLNGPGGDSMGVSAHPAGDDIFEWKAVVFGPDGTPWEGGVFKMTMTFSAEYPLVPPRVKFITKGVFHPNVYTSGDICLDTLKSNWSPTLDVEALLLSIRSLLSDPNPMSAANGEAAQTLTNTPQLYEKRVKELVEQSLEQSFSDMEE